MQRTLVKNNNYDKLISSLESLLPILLSNSHAKNNFDETCSRHKKISDSLNIPLEYETYKKIKISDDSFKHEIIEIADNFLNQFNKTKQIYTFLTVCRSVKNGLYVLAIGVTWSMVDFLCKTNYINSLIVCYIVGILSCVFLAITLKLILKEWKDMGYVKQKNSKRKSKFKR